MLKTNSFYRYLRLAYETNYHRTAVRSFTQVISTRLCDCDTSLHRLAPRFAQLRLLANVKKRKNKKSNNSNEPKKFRQMSESYQPTTNHVSFGGTFDISENDPVNQWRRQSSSNATITPTIVPPNFRVWETVGKKSDTTDSKTLKFKVVSYNVLAQYLLECHPYLYTECAPNNLKWKVRADRLYNEIVSLAPDILCLQEVQSSHLASFYSRFEEIGYFGVFKLKTGHRHDGCAIYFRQSMFQMIDHLNVEFFQPELPLLNRDNIGLMVKLVPRDSPSTPIVVATTHLLYNPKRTDVRLAQMQLFLAEIDRFAYCGSGKQSSYLPIILTGDFNSTPDSAVIRLLDCGRVRAEAFRDSSDWRRIGVTDNCQHLAVYLNRIQGLATDCSMLQLQNTEYRAESSPPPEYLRDHASLFNSGMLAHPLRLVSAYNRCKPGSQLEATTFQDYWVTVDYIYFSAFSNLKLVGRYRLPTAAECDVLGTLPNDTYGSDHLMLAAVFELAPSPPPPRDLVSSL